MKRAPLTIISDHRAVAFLLAVDDPLPGIRAQLATGENGIVACAFRLYLVDLDRGVIHAVAVARPWAWLEALAALLPRLVKKWGDVLMFLDPLTPVRWHSMGGRS